MLELIFSWKALWVLMWMLFLPSCIGLIVIVLLQKGKGSGFAGAFGIGPGSETVFGPRARKSLPVKMTYAMAGLFMVLSLSMSLVAGRAHRGAAPEAVVVEGEEAANAAFDEFLGIGDSSTADPGTSSAPVEAPLPTGAETPAVEIPVVETPAADAVPAEPAADAATPEPAANAASVPATTEPATAN